MSLQFVLGRAQTKKREAMLDRVATILETEPDATIYYIVPEHMTFSTEMSVMEYLAKKPFFSHRPMMGMIQLQVYSFSRLAWFFLQDSAIYNRTQLTNVGLSMLVRKILREWEEDLTIYRGQSRHSGFIQRITDMLIELRSGEVRIEDLDTLMALFSESTEKKDILLKLQDLTLVYESFTQSLFGKYIEHEQIIDSLIEKLKQTDLTKTYFFIDGFDHFSAKEQTLLVEMMRGAKRVEISLTLDKAYPHEKPDTLNLFYQTGETYARLYQQAKAARVPIHFDEVIQERSSEYVEDLRALEEYWIQSHSGEASPSLPNRTGQSAISIWEAENRQAEVLHVANQIRRFTSNGSYRYKDIVVLVRDIEEYRSILLPIFHENGLEVFVDQAETMSTHPFVEMLSSLFAIYKKNWRYHDILRFLRTELFIPLPGKKQADKEARLTQNREEVARFRKKVDVAENVVLAYGYEGSYWTQKEKWTYTTFQVDEMSEQSDADKQIERVANEIKESVSTVLTSFFKKLARSKTNADAAKALYTFLEQAGMTTQLLFWRDEAIEQGDLDDARKQEQVWKTFIQLLEEFVDVLGEEEWDSDTFVSILETGFERATYSMVPPRIDQVILSDLTKTQPTASPVVFMLGLTDKHLPAKAENQSVLTEEERALIDESLEDGKYLRPLAQDLIATEPFLAYRAFTNASQKLYLSYPLKQDGSGDNKLSPYVQRIKEHFRLPMEHKPAEAISLANFDSQKTEELLSFVGSKATTLSQVLLVMRKAKEEHAPPSGFWLELFRYFTRQSADNPMMQTLLSSLDKQNEPVNLTPALAKQLYGEELYLSISQLETFYLDPYSHFLRYGLRLKKREIQELSPAATGSFFHDALDLIFKVIIEEDLSLKEASETEIQAISQRILEQLFQKEAYSILSVSNQMAFIRHQLAKTIHRMMWAMTHHATRTKMKTAKTEVLFGRIGSKEGVPAPEYPLKSGGRVQLRGKIDRIDLLRTEKELYLSVVDYKSSKHTIVFEDLYNGTALQMMTYLYVALMNSELLFNQLAKPAGAFYSHVKNPFLTPDKSLDSEGIEKERLKTHRMEGLIVKEEDILESLDFEIAKETGPSLVYPYTKNKSGTYKKNSKFITMDDLNVLQQHNKKLIVDAGNAILAGELALTPYKDKRHLTPSVNGEYNAISQFDVLNNNRYRIKEATRSNEEIIQQMKEELEEIEEEETLT